MKKTLLLFCFFGSFFYARSQSYFGFRDDNYAGIQSAIFNPSNIVESKYRADVTIFSASGTGQNDLYGVNILDALDGDYDLATDASKTFKSNNKGNFNVDILGPSFMMNITPAHSIALFSRVRSVTNLVGINGQLIDEVNKDMDASNSFLITGGNPNGVTNSWAEIGASYATVLLDRDDHFVKGGITLKYLMAGINGYINGSDVSVAFNKNNADPTLSEYVSTGTIRTAASYDYANGDDPKFDAASAGVGVDLGFTYEYRTNCHSCAGNRYKFKAAASVTDIGKVNYKNIVENTYNITGRVTQQDIDDADDIFDFFDSNYTKISSKKGVKANLPTALHTNFDWNIDQRFYLNLSGDFSLVDAKKVNGTAIANSVTFTPRFETRQFSFYVPVTYMQYSGTAIGAGFRAGPIFIGSGTLFSSLFSNNSKGCNIYAGLKLPIYQDYR
ncbi:DUF5723 family protein [Flavobacterium nitrogenifigens]|uniref:DUF5723 domain-containing protein n=1 Tax=Flavobacterium nitrogenifigens TaxID=1617283 RepID=A0A521AM28_9FLAO|nr:DUF5723 family protein [Flavobacterium nitrogenifigens]KAF2339078.1 hypothetical protein DM397_01915 [Flavobacterium nitrogenifigens]SMO35831.1 hypothetical protein SAMN06265220_101278 [Flavobacterium nitrogenifigens]